MLSLSLSLSLSFSLPSPLSPTLPSLFLPFAVLLSFLILGACATTVYRRERRPVSLDQEQLLLRTAVQEVRIYIIIYI